MGIEFQILETFEDHERMVKLMLQEQWSDRKHNALNWDYFHAADTSEKKPLSCVVLLNGTPQAIALGVMIDQTWNYFGSGMDIHFAPSANDQSKLAEGIIKHLTSAAEKQNVKSIEFLFSPIHADTLLPHELTLLNLGFQCQSKHFAILDLKPDEASLKSDIRKSYKSLINFGLREINLIADCGADACANRFEAFRQFHIKTAGRETRPKESWDAMFDQLKSKQAECLYGYDGDDLVSCSFFPHYNATTIYGTGVYDRERFDKPISHAPLWQAILNAKAHGDSFFDLGECYLQPEASPKEHNIAYFKKGFTSRVEPWKAWKWVADESDDRNLASE